MPLTRRVGHTAVARSEGLCHGRAWPGEGAGHRRRSRDRLLFLRAAAVNQSHAPVPRDGPHRRHHLVETVGR